MQINRFSFLFKFYLFVFFSFTILLVLLKPSFMAASELDSNKELKVKKMVMMLAIVSKEYELAVKDGKIVNDVEYEESQAFLDIVTDKFASISDQFKVPADGEKIKNQLAELKVGLGQKKHIKKLKVLVNSIQNGLLKEFGVRITKSPKRSVSLKNGESIYNANCAQCHGISGLGDGPVAAQLDPKPAILADPEITGNEYSTPYDNFEVINVGIANTAMVAWADKLSEEEIWDATYYIRTFSNKNLELPNIKNSFKSEVKDSIQGTISKIKKLIIGSLENYKASNNERAAEAAFDAYLLYETVEAGLIAKRKNLGLRLQANFSQVRGEIKRNASKGEIAALVEDIDKDLDLAIQVLSKKEQGKGLFIQSFSIIVREGFETILILSALITFLIKSRNERQVKIIYLGASIGVLASFLTAYIIHEVLHITSANKEILEGAIMLVAASMLFYISYWLISKIGAERFQKFVSGKLQEAMKTGSVLTLAALAFLSVYREGFETVLFYEALYTYSGESVDNILPGFLAGCIFLFGVFYLINKMGAKIPINWFFGVTSIFLYFMAFIFTGKGLHAIQEGGGLPLTSVSFLPEVHWLGLYPTLETSIGQGIILGALVFGFIYTLSRMKEKTN